MRSTYFVMAALSMALSLAAPPPDTDGSQKVSAAHWLDSHSFAIAGHRGCWQGTAENSLQALANCSAAGIDAAEGDIHTTKDGVLVWIHDDALDRTTNRSGRIADQTYAEIQSARLRMEGGGPNASLTDQRIPRLRDVLDAARRMVLILDIKEDNYDTVFDEVKAAGAEERVIFLAYAAPSKIRKARFLHRSAFIPALIQCHPRWNVPNCYRAEDLVSGRAFRDFEDLAPLAYWPAPDDDIADRVAAYARKAGVRIADCPDGELEAKTPEELQGVWTRARARNVSILVSNRALELIKEVKLLK